MSPVFALEQVFINSIILMVFGSALSFVAAWFWFNKNQAIREAELLKNQAIKEKELIAVGHEKLVQQVLDMQNKISLLNQSVLPISTAFQAILIRELTHYHTPEMDALMVKLGPPKTLTADEEQRLLVLLEERTRDLDGKISESERDAAHMLPLMMKRAATELANTGVPSADVRLRLVSIIHGQDGHEDEPDRRSARRDTADVAKAAAEVAEAVKVAAAKVAGAAVRAAAASAVESADSAADSAASASAAESSAASVGPRPARTRRASDKTP